MQRSEKEIANREELDRILRSGKYATIALTGEDGPYIITLSYGYDKDRIYFHTAKKGRKLDMIDVDPRACATVIEDRGYLQGKCDHAYRSVVVHGSIRRVEDPDEMLHALNVMIDRLEDDPATVKERLLPRKENFQSAAILCFDIASITGRTNG